MNPTPRQYEAFGDIVRHGGLAPAARATGIDPSTLSKHLAALEDQLGTRLIERDPFSLLRPGRRLFDAIERGRALLQDAVRSIVAEARPSLHFVAAEVVTLHYLPGIMERIERLHPQLQCSTESGSEEWVQKRLCDGDASLAIAPENDGWPGCRHMRLIELPLVLLSPSGSPVRSAADLWARPRIDDVLFVSAAAESVTRRFDAGLHGLQVKWPNRRRVSSALGVSQRVADGSGIGVTVGVPSLTSHPGVRALPLPGFQTVPLAVYWRDEPTEAHRTAIELLQAIARELAEGGTAGNGRSGKVGNGKGGKVGSGGGGKVGNWENGKAEKRKGGEWRNGVAVS